MRDPNRIYKTCIELANLWSKVPDWRLGQFLVNVGNYYECNYGKDLFFLEEDELIKAIKEYFQVALKIDN